ncbi:hypothetical protein WKI65_42405 [Streptomyces sp. MS1.AVA.3]|uniref:hypothetical protein n=1 Tax=Streptomyces decoyicus TaxID=249567 RepID=UPI0030C2552E
MRTANLGDRLVLVLGDGAVDVEQASGGVFPSDPQAVFERWEEFTEWAPTPAAQKAERLPLEDHRLRAPVPRPRQVSP